MKSILLMLQIQFPFVSKLRERSEEEVSRFRTENSIAIVSGQEKAPKPTLAFDEVGFPKEILDVLAVRITDAVYSADRIVKTIVQLRPVFSINILEPEYCKLA